MRKLPVFLCMTLFLAGCGSKPAETSAPADAPEETAEQADPGLIYDTDDLTIRFMNLNTESTYSEIQLQVTNHKEKEISFVLDKIIINDEIATDGIFYENIPAGGTIEASATLDTEMLVNKGLDKIGKLQGYLTVRDEEYDTMTDQELITIYEDPSVSVNPLNPSEVIYLKSGIIVSYEGIAENGYNNQQFSFLVENSSTEPIEVSFESDIFKLNEEYDFNKSVNGSYITVPVGKKALISGFIYDKDALEPVAFDSADLWLTFDTGNRPALYVPIHMTREEETVSATAGDPYIYGELSHMTYRINAEYNYEEYLTFYYDRLYNRLEGITDEAKYFKSEGYTKEYFETEDVKKAISVYDDLAFEETIMDETETTIDLIWIFRDLANPDNLKQMHEIGYLTLANPDNPAALNAEAMFKLYDDAEMEKIDPSEYEELNLHIDVY